MHKSGNSTNRRFIRGERLAWQKVGEEMVVVDLGRNHAYSLNLCGSVLWKQLENASTTDDLASLLDAAAGDRESVKEDVASFLDELKDAGLIIATDRPSSGELARSEIPPTAGEGPRIVWREELRACVMQGSCGFGPGSACEAYPPGPFGP